MIYADSEKSKVIDHLVSTCKGVRAAVSFYNKNEKATVFVYDSESNSVSAFGIPAPDFEITAHNWVWHDGAVNKVTQDRVRSYVRECLEYILDH